MKTCSRCKLEKELTEFYVRRLTNGYVPICKSCSSASAKKRYVENKEHINTVNARWKKENTEKHKAINAKWRKDNQERHKESGKKWYVENSHKKKKTTHLWYLANRDKVIKKNAKWKTDNPERAKEIRQKTQANIMATPQGKLNSSLSSGIGRSLKGLKAGRHWEDMVGFTVHDLKNHLEKNFTSVMNWDNYGAVWEIDHIIPKSMFNYLTPGDIDFRRCWSLRNLRPLAVSENRKKYCKLIKPHQPSLLIGEAIYG